MRISILLFVVATSLSACALVPYPTSGNKNHITVYQPYVGKWDRERATLVAEEHCKKFGKKAHLKADKGNKILFDCY